MNLPKGIVLVGDPGIGKTYLSQFIFSKIRGEVLYLKKDSDTRFPNMKKTYADAREIRDKIQKPVVLFMDELGYICSVTDEVELKEFQEELSGIQSKRNNGIYFVGTSNELSKNVEITRKHPLFRPGRLEIIELSPPNLQAKAKIFDLYLRKTEMKYEGDCDTIARMVPNNQTGAFIRHVVEITHATLLLKNRSSISDIDLLKTLVQTLSGNRIDDILNHEQRQRVAYHELGHYLVARELGFNVGFVSIDNFADSLGRAYLEVHDSDVLHTKEDVEKRIKIYMGGYLLENQKYDKNCSIGFLEDSKKIHNAYLFLYALNNIGVNPVHLFPNNKGEYLVQVKIPDDELKQFEDDVKKIFKKYEGQINSLVNLLMEKGIVYSKELEELLK